MNKKIFVKIDALFAMLLIIPVRMMKLLIMMLTKSLFLMKRIIIRKIKSDE